MMITCYFVWLNTGNPATRDFNTAPCIDTCGDLYKRREQEAYIQKEGAKLKQKYIQAGINHQNGVGRSVTVVNQGFKLATQYGNPFRFS